jgi:hypothetical protein
LGFEPIEAFGSVAPLVHCTGPESASSPIPEPKSMSSYKLYETGAGFETGIFYTFFFTSVKLFFKPYNISLFFSFSSSLVRGFSSL